MRNARRLLATGLALALPLAACGDDGSGGGFDKRGTGERRTDLAPLTDRFGALGEPVSAVWYSGTLGSARVPGPSTFWIDAVIELTPEVAGRLRSDHALAPRQAEPDVVDALRDALPAELVGGPDLDALFSSSAFVVRAHLAVADDRLVLVAVGEG